MAQSDKLKFKIGAKARAKSFSDPDELFALLDERLSFWDFLKHAPANSNAIVDLGRWYDTQFNRYTDIKRTIKDQTRRNGGDWNTEAVLKQIPLLQSTINNLYDAEKQFHLFQPKSEQYRFIDQVKSVSGVAAYSALRHLLTESAPDIESNKAYGLSAAVHFLDDKNAYHSSFEGTLGDLRSDFDDVTKGTIDEAEVEFQKALNDFEDKVVLASGTLSSCEQDRDLSKSQWDRLRSIILDGLRDGTAQNKELMKEFEQTKATFNKFMKLKAPADHWADKKRSHIWLSVACAAVLFIYVGLVGVSVLNHFAEVFAAYELSIIISPLVQQQAINPPLWKLLHTALVTLIFLWGIRIIVRLLLSQIHLATDAHERSMLITTYLAMTHEGKDFTPESEEVMLATIFRPSASGLVKDDGMPFFVDAVSKSISSSGKP
jgi:hypothetical protein